MVCTAAARKAPETRVTPKNIRTYLKYMHSCTSKATLSFHNVYATSEEAFVTDSGNRRMLLAFFGGANTDCILDNSDSASVGMYCTTKSEGPPCSLVSVWNLACHVQLSRCTSHSSDGARHKRDTPCIVWKCMLETHNPSTKSFGHHHLWRGPTCLLKKHSSF